jgi:hypothetical protein
MSSLIVFFIVMSNASSVAEQNAESKKTEVEVPIIFSIDDDDKSKKERKPKKDSGWEPTTDPIPSDAIVIYDSTVDGDIKVYHKNPCYVCMGGQCYVKNPC